MSKSQINKNQNAIIKAPSIIPMPTDMMLSDGIFIVDSKFHIELSCFTEPRLERAVKRLLERLMLVTGISMHQDLAIKEANARLRINVVERANEIQSAKEDESYTLDVKANGAVLNSRTPYGALRGIETFIQLVQPCKSGYIVQAVHIIDRPRFQWRGLLIDATRHWIPPHVIKRNLEAMALVKFNVLHWHLTDDQGFRIESKRFPKLHELGSDGHFYTQEEIKDIVGFASDRGIRVLPEFDMPGHTSSWFVGYPELASALGPYKIERGWGDFKALMNPASEATYEFIKCFLEEMATLFTDPFVHIGGDLMNDNHWQGSPEIQKFMLNKGIKDTRQLQAYFNKRLFIILHDLDKELVGWDPIIHADLPSKSIIQSVRGQKWLVEATSKGFRGIAGSEYYLDLLEPASFYYEKDPFSSEAEELTTAQQKLILGGEASMWSEFANEENIDSRIWPRATAVAERLWSTQEVKNVDDMYQRLSIMSQRFDFIGITHISGPQKILRDSMHFDSISTLNTLAEVLRPNFDIRWKNKNYTSLTPLNRVVDAISPDSETARWFSKIVDKFIETPSNLHYQDAIIDKMKIWRDNHEVLCKEIQESNLLDELLPVSETLMKVAEIGIRSVTILSAGQKMEFHKWKKQETILSEANQIISEFIVLIIPDIQKLSKTILTIQ